MCHFSLVQLFATLQTVALQAPLSTGFSKQEHWSGLPRPPPGDLLVPEVKPTSPALAGSFLPLDPPRRAPAQTQPCSKYTSHRSERSAWFIGAYTWECINNSGKQARLGTSPTLIIHTSS